MTKIFYWRLTFGLLRPVGTWLCWQQVETVHPGPGTAAIKYIGLMIPRARVAKGLSWLSTA